MKPLELGASVCLDSLVDLQDLATWHPYLCRGIGLARRHIQTVTYGSILTEFPTLAEAAAEQAADENFVADGLFYGSEEYNVFTAYLKPVDVIGWELPLLLPKKIAETGGPVTDRPIRTPHYDNFVHFVEYLEGLPLFTAIDRLTVWLRPPGFQTPVHNQAMADPTAHHLWIQVIPSCSPFLYDAVLGKVPLEGQILFTDTSQYFGIDAGPYHNYLLRVSGQFTPETVEFIEKVQG